MTSWKYSEVSLENVSGKVCVLSGGSNGIGEATVRRMNAAGAYVVFGDVDTNRGVTLAKDLEPNVLFRKTDVMIYNDIYALFKFAFDTFGRVDIAVSNAAVNEHGNFIDPELDANGVKELPNLTTMDVNFRGTLWFTRVAAAFLKQNARPEEDKSLLLFSSVAGFKETPGLPVYQATKHAVIGLMRALRPVCIQTLGFRINCICPYATKTQMTESFSAEWEALKLPLSTPDDQARVVLAISADPNLNGESVYVEQDRAWLIEANIERLEPEWLGAEASQSLMRGQEFLGSGTKWRR